jgi:diketogulonate reductase-like aldo/keto reductase
LVGEECENSVYDAIKIGYRHIDGAEAYRNDIDIGKALKRAIHEGLLFLL